MNAALLVLIASLGGTHGGGYADGYASNHHGEGIYAADQQGCADCNGGARGCRGGHCGKGGHQPHGGWLGMMPQTCYDPPFGCYDGSRHNNRYPAFHGTYYRRPYNYRNVFDYPWHAELHEPTSNFAYNVNEPAATIVVPGSQAPAPIVTPSPDRVPVPVPDAQGRYQRQRASTPARPASFLKRDWGR